MRIYLANAHPIIGCILASCLLLLIATPPAFANDTDKQQQLQKLNREMDSLRKLLDGFQSQRSELQRALKKSEVSIGNIQQRVRRIQRQLASEQQQLKTLQKQRQQLNAEKRQQQKYIEQQILAAYQIGQQKKIKLLLNQQQPDKVSRALAYYDRFNRARKEQIDSYLETIEQLNRLEPAIAAKTDSLTKARQALGREHDQLLATQQQRQQSLAKINSSIKSKDQRLKQIERDRKELERLLDAVEQTLADISIPGEYQPFQQLRGKLPWPVAGTPSNRFGKRRSDSSLRWQGLSIPARAGSRVEAIHSGRVVFADWLRGSGLLIIIDHGDGYMSLYGHNQSLLRELGEWVNPGDLIATVGNSGGQQNAGLYFEIRHNGKPTDPSGWCRRV